MSVATKKLILSLLRDSLLSRTTTSPSLCLLLHVRGRWRLRHEGYMLAINNIPCYEENNCVAAEVPPRLAVICVYLIIVTCLIDFT